MHLESLPVPLLKVAVYAPCQRQCHAPWQVAVVVECLLQCGRAPCAGTRRPARARRQTQPFWMGTSVMDWSPASLDGTPSEADDDDKDPSFSDDPEHKLARKRKPAAETRQTERDQAAAAEEPVAVGERIAEPGGFEQAAIMLDKDIVQAHLHLQDISSKGGACCSLQLVEDICLSTG